MTLDATELRKLHELKPCPKCLLMPFERSVLFCDHPCHRPEPASETFEQAWAATGYHYGEDALVELPVDSGMNAESVERAEFLWASLPTMRKWTSLATHEKALVCHLLDHELAASKAKLEAAEEAAGHAAGNRALYAEGHGAGQEKERADVVAWLDQQITRHYVASAPK